MKTNRELVKSGLKNSEESERFDRNSYENKTRKS